MAGTHRGRRRSSFPFVGVLVVLVVVVGGVLIARPLLIDDGAGGEPRGPRAAGTSAPPATTEPKSSPPAKDEPRQEEEPKGGLLIHAAGDVSLDPTYITTYRTRGYDYAWSGLNGLFERDDLTMVNVECAVSNKGSPVPKEFNFEGDPDALPAMRKAGIEVGNLGNNHSYDFGPDALLDTRKNLERAGIAPIGAGKDPDEALSPGTFEINGWRIAVVGWDEVVDPYPTAVAAPNHPGTAAGHDFRQVLRAVRAADRRADLVFVFVHWGVELDTQPREYDVQEGHRLIDAGVDAIFGSHAHRLQPLSMYRGRPIFWGLGNFVWPNFSAEGSRTAVAEVEISDHGRFKARLIPAYIASSGHPVLRGN